ncbi:hypothetical protein Acel_0899 [Acidothermus cellulolyticus 11B]|uniref:Activator of Hsp90 ATPase 1 family protein n=1 Tax=Acidothermus cellulolyticus (strain ATCC 43068 / DSM 8971 / 11B) TaxID=351607 RepID=A0LTB2_ACIC1|nr:hypothetical protein [Acidothermus cellulolyticus]ABK52672.1 hypothetical protein Acel_0899 [Acidothermus cellulolyticus 11B]MBX6372219.1 hypothetical protein [Acidothermus sp.]MCL6550833.1 hypothetical protein [Acidothermus cellulolyticus]
MTETQALETPLTVEPVHVTFVPQRVELTADLRLGAMRRRVFDALLQPATWWPLQRGAVVVEPRVGGRVYVDYADGCGVLLGHVTRLLPPEEFVVAGAFGLPGPAIGVWETRLSTEDRTTRLVARLCVVGEVDESARRGLLRDWDAAYAALAAHFPA